MHGFYTYLEGLAPGPVLHELSHGESFLEVLRTSFDGPGFYVLDEPESALSFSGCLALVGTLLAFTTYAVGFVVLMAFILWISAFDIARLGQTP